MQKSIRTLIYGLPVLFFTLTGIMNLAVDSTGETVDGSTLLALDFSFGTLLSPMLMYFLLAIVGLALTNNKQEGIQSVGKALYGVAMISAFFIYRDAGLAYEFISETAAASINDMAFGGILLLVSSFSGIALALSFIVIPVIDGLAKNLYGKSFSSNSQKEAKDPFDKLRQWKELLNENVVSEEEYNQIKTQVLASINLKKGSLLDIVSTLKNVEKEGIISAEDFEEKKKEVLV